MDAVQNFVIVTVASGGFDNVATDIALATSERAKLPDPATVGNYNLVIWNDTDYAGNPTADPSHEIVRNTAFGGVADHITVVRPGSGNNYLGEGSANTAVAHNTGGKTYKMAMVPTQKQMDDIRTGFSNGAPLWGLRHKNIVASITTVNGENDLYTVPAGKRAIVLAVGIYNVSGTSPAAIAKIKRSGSYYRMSASSTLTSGVSTNITGVMAPLEAGESFSLNVAAAIACNIFVRIVEFDKLTTPIAFARKFGTDINNGDTTLYTCPAGYSAMALTALDFPAAGSTAVTTVKYGNDTGGSRTLKLNLVPSGGAVGAGNLYIGSQSGTNAAVTGMTAYMNLEAGDFVNLNVDSNSASQVLTAIFFESPIPLD